MKSNVIISKILEYTDKILKYSANMSYEDFVENEMVMEACVFNLSQIGELANKLDDEYKQNHKEIAWSQIYGLRNRIVHDYEGVNLKLVWEIIAGDLPELRDELQKLRQV